MIRLKEVRFKNLVPGFGGNLSIRDDKAEMYLAPESQMVLIRKRGPAPEDFIVPGSTCESMRPMLPLENVFYIAPEEAAAPPPPAKTEAPGPAPATPPPPAAPQVAPAPVEDDKIRLVKINGVIVERKGKMLDDELEALTAPRKTVAQMIAEADGQHEE